MRLRNRIAPAVVALALVTAFVVTSCGAARHVAVQVDASFATAVFAASDAAMAACKQGVFPQAQCIVGGAVNQNAQQALIDVKAITQALQDAPKDATIPKNLPDLLTALTNLQTLIADLAPAGPTKQVLVERVSAAVHQAILVLQTLTKQES